MLFSKSVFGGSNVYKYLCYTFWFMLQLFRKLAGIICFFSFHNLNPHSKLWGFLLNLLFCVEFYLFLEKFTNTLDKTSLRKVLAGESGGRLRKGS